MGYFISAISGLAVTILSSILISTIKENQELRKRRETELKKAEENNTKLTLAMARIFLLERMEKAISDGYVTSKDYEITRNLYDAYIESGGNGVIKHMHDSQYNNLPIREE